MGFVVLASNSGRVSVGAAALLSCTFCDGGLTHATKQLPQVSDCQLSWTGFPVRGNAKAKSKYPSTTPKYGNGAGTVILKGALKGTLKGSGLGPGALNPRPYVNAKPLCLRP